MTWTPDDGRLGATGGGTQDPGSGNVTVLIWATVIVAIVVAVVLS